MATFRTVFEQQKWREIESSERLALDRMADGSAGPEDIKAVQRLVSRYHKLLDGQLRQTVQQLHQTAEERLTKIAVHRAAKGKQELTEEQFSKLFSLAITRAWQESSKDLAETIEDTLHRELEQQNKDIDSLLSSKIKELAPRAPDNDRELAEELSRELARPDAGNAVQRAIGQEHDTRAAEDSVVPISDSLIEQANKSFEVSEDIRDGLEELTNPNERKKTRAARIKEWFRNLSALGFLRSMTSKGRGLGLGLVALLGKLLVTELSGGRLWETIRPHLSLDGLKNLGSTLMSTAESLMSAGWATLSKYLSLENIKKLVGQALQSGVSFLGNLGSSILGFFNDDGAQSLAPAGPSVPVVPDTTLAEHSAMVPGPGSSAPAPAAHTASVPGPEPVPDTGTTVDVPTELPTEAVPVPPPGQEVAGAVDPQTRATELLAQIPVTPQSDEPISPDIQLTSKGASLQLPPARTRPVAPTVSLGDRSQNMVTAPPPASVPQQPQSQQQTQTSGGVQATLAGYDKGVSVDGTLTALNLGMLTG